MPIQNNWTLFNALPVGAIFRDEHGTYWRKIANIHASRQGRDAATMELQTNAVLLMQAQSLQFGARYFISSGASVEWPLDEKTELDIRTKCIQRLDQMMTDVGLGENPPRRAPVPEAVPMPAAWGVTT